MAVQTNPDGTVSIVDDVSGMPLADSVPPDMLGSLYNPGAIAPPVATDLRVAGPGGGGGGAGGTTGNPVPQAMGAEGQPSATPAPDPNMSVAPPAPMSSLSQDRLGGPETMSAGAPGTPSAPSVGLTRVQSPDVSKYLLGGARGSAGRVVKEHDRLTDFKVDVAPKRSEETKLEQEISNVQQQRSVAEGGMLRRAAAEAAALANERQHQEKQREIAGIRDEERQRNQIVGARMREIDMLGDELRDKRANARFGPEAYWEDKGVVGTILAKIGMALYAGGSGIAGYDPMGLAKEINAQAENYNAGKRVEIDLLGKEIDRKESQLNQVRKQFLSRDAADAATRALMNESMAAETASLAEHYKSAEAQASAQQLMAALRGQAAAARAEAELAEKDAVTQAWKHVPTQVVGGSPGGLEGILARGRKVGINNIADALIAARTGVLPVSQNELEQAKFELESNKSGKTGDSLDVPGIGQARSEMDAKEMREELANYLAAKNNFAKARVLGKKFSSGVGAFGRGTDEYHGADALTQQLVTQVAKSYGGVITDADRESAKKEVPDLTSYGAGWETRLEAAERKVENNFKSRVAAKIRGGMPAPVPSRDQ